MAVSLRRDGFCFLQDFCGRRAARVAPSSRYFQVAIGTVAVFQPICLHIMPTSANKERLAGRARRACRIAMNVSLIDIVQSGFSRNSASAVQCLGRRSRLVSQFKIRMEGGEVQGDVWPQVLEDPVSQAAEFLSVVIQCRND